MSGVEKVERLVVKPIRLGKSLYLLVPSQIAKVTEITENSRFVLKLVHGKRTILEYQATAK